MYIWWLGLGWTGLGLGQARAQGKNVHWHENAANWHHINEFRTEQIHRKSMQNAANGLKINAERSNLTHFLEGRPISYMFCAHATVFERSGGARIAPPVSLSHPSLDRWYSETCANLS